MVSSTLTKALLAAAVGVTAVQAECTFTWGAEDGDTCQSMADFWGLSLADFIEWNPSVGADCKNGLEPGTEYCIEWDNTTGEGGGGDDDDTPTPTTTTEPGTTHTSDPSKPSPTQEGLIDTCTNFYMVVSGDNCASIVQQYGGAFTVEDFLKWNPAVGETCTNLWLDNYVCVGIPGTPTSPPVTTETSNPNAPSPTQAGLISTCTDFYKVVSGDTCAKIVAKYRTFSVPEFLKWNPAAGDDCSGIWTDYYVCVGVPGTPSKPTTTQPSGPTPTQDGVSKKCNKWYKVASGDNCDKIRAKYDNAFSQATFYSWNPAINKDCSGLWVDYYVCVGTTDPLPPVAPEPTQDGIASNCSKYYKAKSGDNCEKIVKANSGLTLSNFYKWNPAVGNNCQSLWLGYYYCVAVK